MHLELYTLKMRISALKIISPHFVNVISHCDSPSVGEDTFHLQLHFSSILQLHYDALRITLDTITDFI